MSTESEDEVKRNTGYQNFSKTIYPLEPWTVIEKTSLIKNVYTSKEVITRKTLGDYARCKIGAFEDLFDFREIFGLKYKSYGTQGNSKGEKEDVVIDFPEALDRSRYGDFVVEMINDV